MDISLIEVNLSDLRVHPTHRDIYTNTKAGDLITYMMDNNIINPLKIVKVDCSYRSSKHLNGSDRSGYYILSGVRRYRAMKALGYERCYCHELFPSSFRDEIQILLIDNAYRKKTKYEICREQSKWRKIELNRLYDNSAGLSKSDIDTIKSNIEDKVNFLLDIKEKISFRKIGRIIDRIDYLERCGKKELANLLIDIFNTRRIGSCYLLMNFEDDLLLDLGKKVLSLDRKVNESKYIERYKDYYYSCKYGINVKLPDFSFGERRVKVRRDFVVDSIVFGSSVLDERILLPTIDFLVMDLYLHGFNVSVFERLRSNFSDSFIGLVMINERERLIQDYLSSCNLHYQELVVRYRPNPYEVSKEFFISSYYRFLFINPYKVSLVSGDCVNVIDLDISTSYRERIISETCRYLLEKLSFTGSNVYHYCPLGSMLLGLISRRFGKRYYSFTDDGDIYVSLLNFVSSRSEA